MPAIAEVLLILIVSGWLAGWLLLTRVPLLKNSTEFQSTPKLSVLIPARNEAGNLPRLLTSLWSQTPLPDEVIVADDNSTDGTGEIAAKFGAKVVTVPPLEKGWTGKTWALRHAALKAENETLFLLDADIWLQPGSLQAIRSSWVKADKPGVISILPFHETRAWFEGLSLFFNILMAAGAGGFGFFGKARLFGQSLVINRDDFLRLGSNKDVAGQVLENFSMSQKLEQEGFSIICVSGKGLLSFRMFPEGLKSLIEGWSKAFARGAAGTTLSVLLTSIIWMIGIGSTTVVIVLSLTSETLSLPSGITWISYFLFLSQIAYFASRLGIFSIWSFVLFPVTFLAYQMIFLKSVLIASGFAKASWRGRELP